MFNYDNEKSLWQSLYAIAFDEEYNVQLERCIKAGYTESEAYVVALDNASFEARAITHTQFSAYLAEKQ